MTQYDQLDSKNLECMVCRKHTKKALYFALYCLWQVCSIMNLASGWLAYCNLCWSGFRHIAFQIRLRLLRPCKILTSTLMSSCVLLMCPACSSTFPLMKPSKSVQKPFTTILTTSHSKERVCWIDEERYILGWIQLQQHYIQANTRSSYGITTWSGFG